tara:strand:- start:1242 stop:1502 length:261 start_codon:yes stop_codon:yes gene_type:complete
MARLTKFNQLEGSRSNATELVYDDGRKLLYSYETLVGGYHPDPDLKWIRTAKTYSVSTDKHIRNYFNNVANPKMVHEDILEKLKIG